MNTVDSNLKRQQRDFSLVLGGYAFFEALYAACELDLFTFLSRNPECSRTTVRRHLKLPAQSTEVLLGCCRSLGLIETPSKDAYVNSALSGHLLVRGRPRSMLPIVKAYHALIYRPMHDLLPALRAGNNVGLAAFPGRGRHLYQRLQREQQEIFHAWMKAVGAQSDFAGQVVPRIAPLLRDKRTVVDVGGGDATNAISLCSRLPHLKVVVFDLPGARHLAMRNIRAHKLLNRISFRSGDFHKDPLPRGVVGIMFSHIFNIYSEKKNVRLLKKASRALNPRGLAVIFNGVTEEDKPWPLPAAHISLYFLALASGEGMAYPIERYSAWLKTSGFRDVQANRLPRSAHGIIVGKK